MHGGGGVAGIVFANRNEQGARAAAEESKCYAQNAQYRSIAVAVDVTDPSSVQEMVDQTIQEFGRIDYGFNSAGVSKETRPTLSCLAEGSRVVSLNLSSGNSILRTLTRCFKATRLIPC